MHSFNECFTWSELIWACWVKVPELSFCSCFTVNWFAANNDPVHPFIHSTILTYIGLLKEKQETEVPELQGAAAAEARVPEETWTLWSVGNSASFFVELHAAHVAVVALACLLLYEHDPSKLRVHMQK